MSLLWMDSFDAYTPNSTNAKPFNQSQCYVETFSAGVGSRWGQGQFMYRHDFLSKKVLSTPSDNMYIGFAACLTFAPSNYYFQLTDAQQPTDNFRMRVTNTQVELYRGTSNLLGVLTYPAVYGAWHYFEMKAFAHSSTGWFKLRIDNQLIWETGGMNTTNGTLFDSFSIMGEGGGGNGANLDDLFVCANDPTGFWIGDCHVSGIYATGNGSTIDFTGTPYTTDTYRNINEIVGPDTANYNYSATDGATDLFKYGLSTGVSGIYGLKICTFASRDNTEIAYIAPEFSDGITPVTGDPTLLLLTPQWNTKLWELNPATSLPWTAEDIISGEFGYKVIK